MGAKGPRGRRWGAEGPPLEAYSRVTNPERFRPLHGFAERLVNILEQDYDVARDEGQGLDGELERVGMARPTVRLRPQSPDAGALTIAFTSFPGLCVRLGHWFVEPIPGCGCDACDETAEQGRRRLEWMVGALTSGRVTESIKLGVWGDGWLIQEISSSGREERGKSRTTRVRARESIARAGGVRRFDYGPWPRRESAGSEGS
jgi:hypothetical protein